MEHAKDTVDTKSTPKKREATNLFQLKYSVTVTAPENLANLLPKFANLELKDDAKENKEDFIAANKDNVVHTDDKAKEADGECVGTNNSDVKNDKEDIHVSDVTAVFLYFCEQYDFAKKAFHPISTPKGGMAIKHASNAPFYIFYTAIATLPETHNAKNSITFQDILDYSLGELKNSLHLTGRINFRWLLWNYMYAGYRKNEMTLIYDRNNPVFSTELAKRFPKVRTCSLQAGNYKFHNVSIGVLCYDDGSVRVYVTSTHLVPSLWIASNSAVWLSPKCPEMAESAGGESRTGFKGDLLRYLQSYSLDEMSFYVERVKRCDFSAVNVFFVGSVPGCHTNSDCGMKRVEALLQNHCPISKDDNSKWDLIVHTRYLGKYGTNAEEWLRGQFLKCFCATKGESCAKSNATLKIVFPPLEYIKDVCKDMTTASQYVAHSIDNYNTQKDWIKEYLYQWSAECSGRTGAFPHAGVYMRVARGLAAYCMLTSANAGRDSWGLRGEEEGETCVVGNYEAGVLFMPEFVINEKWFPLTGRGEKCLPIIFDLPLKPYEEGMTIYTNDVSW